MSIARYEDEVYGPSSYDFEENESGSWVKYEDHAAEVARLNEQVQALAAERDEAINSQRNHAARLIDERSQLRQRLEAAEAQVKELTADLDKESEIRHRIHEELADIKGGQQPIGYIDSASLREYRGVKAGGSWSAQPKTGEYNQTTPIYTHPAPAVLPPEITFEYVQGLGEYCYCSESFAKGANWMRQQVLDMGAKPLLVVDLTPEINPLMFNEDVIFGFKKARQQDITSIRAAGLEVKS